MLKKTLKWIGRILLGLAILVALFYIVENARGKYAWEQYKRECAAKGINLDWQSLIPPPIPDDENIAMAPIFQEMFASPPSRWIRLPSPSFTPDPNTIRRPVWQTGRWEGLAPWRVALSNDNLLAALSVYDDYLREIEEALKRPSFRLEAWDTVSATEPVPLFSFTPSFDFVRIYFLRAMARHEVSQYDGMLEDIRMGFHIANRSLKDSPIHIYVLMRIAALQQMCVPLWLGLNGRVWDAQQLASLQAILDEINLAEHTAQVIRFESRLFTSLLASRHTYTWTFGLASGITWNDWGEMPQSYIIPRGWFYQNAVHYAKTGEQLERTIHTDDRWLNISQVKHLLENEKTNTHPYSMLARMSEMPFFLDTIRQIAQGQTTIHQAVIACAIERYRLEHGRIPERLDELVPAYLAKIPCDPCDGQPMRYKPTGGNNAILYSIGWNGVDDDGQLGVKKKNGVDVADSDSGDWIWRLGAEE